MFWKKKSSQQESTEQNGDDTALPPWIATNLPGVSVSVQTWFKDMVPANKVHAFSRAENELLERLDLSPSEPIIPDQELDISRLELVPFMASELGQAIAAHLESKGVIYFFDSIEEMTPLRMQDESFKYSAEYTLRSLWSTENDSSFVQGCNIYRDKKGKEFAYWHVDLLVASRDFDLFTNDSESGPLPFDFEELLPIGTSKTSNLTHNYALPTFLARLALICETPFPSSAHLMAFERHLAFGDTPESAYPKPAYSFLRHHPYIAMSTDSNGEPEPLNDFAPELVRFGWTFGEATVQYFEETLSRVVDGCTLAMSTVEQGFLNFRSPETDINFDRILLNTSVFAEDFSSGDGYDGQPAWLPMCLVGGQLQWTMDTYGEAVKRGKNEAQLLAQLSVEGIGYYFPHAMNTMLFSHYLPQVGTKAEILDQIELVASIVATMPVPDQAANAVCNLGIAYYQNGDLQRAEKLLLKAIDMPGSGSLGEASYVLTRLYEEAGQRSKVEKYQRIYEQSDGYSPKRWLRMPGQAVKNEDSAVSDFRAAFCVSCGSKFVSESANFCTNCGAERG